MRFVPLPFFVGLAVGLFSLAWLGANVPNSRLAHRFVRFHTFLTGTTGYFPTSRELETIIDDLGTPKVYVIVGGSSVLQGVGQEEALIWTRFLQEHLGPEFRVINFAQLSGSAIDYGAVASEMLLRQSRPVIFVSDATTYNYAIALESSFYSQIIFDAWTSDVLLHWPPRDKLLSNTLWHGSDKLRNVARGAVLNSYLKFNELWNFVSYEYGGSIWQPILNTRSFEPRRDFADPEMAEGDRAKIRYRQNVEEMVGYIRGGIALRNNDQYWVGAMQLADTLFPPALRAVSVVTMDFPSPYYSGRLNESEGKSLMEQASEHAERLRKLGFNQVDISRKDFTEDDYVDYVHMSVAGGKKLAASLAPIIRDMAKTIGYIP